MPSPRPLPPGLDPLEPLGAGGTLHRVRRGSEELVLRWLNDPRALRAESAALRSARHPRLVKPLEFGVHGGRAWCLRPYLRGRTLDRALDRGLPVGPEHAAVWARDLLGALGALHDAGLVHRDVKAANVIVSEGRAHLIDLDLAAGSGDAGIGVTGTAAHVAPEVLCGAPATPRSDLFSLGATLAFAWFGAPSASRAVRFPANAFEEAFALDLEALPAEVRELVRRLVRRRPQDRPTSARAALELLPGVDRDRPPELELPPLAGREAFAPELVAEVLRHGVTTVVAVEDAGEVEPLALDLELASLAAGARAARGSFGRERRRTGVAPASLTILTPGEDLEAERRVESLLEGWLHGAQSGSRILVLPAALAREFVRSLRTEELEGLAASEPATRFVELPGVGVEELRRRLDAWTAGVNPELCARLAADAVARTRGRASEIATMLERAETCGVLRATGGSWTPLRDSWPDSCDGAEEELAPLPDPARDTLQALVELGGRARPERLGAVVGDDELETGLAALRRAGALAPGFDGRGRLRLAGSSWRTAVRSLGEDARARRIHRRVLDELRAANVPLEQLVRVECARPVQAARREGLLADGDRLRRSGQLAAARTVGEALRGAARTPGRGTTAALALTLLARLDAAQGDVRGALERLTAAWGATLRRAEVEARLVAAEARVQLGEIARGREELVEILRQELPREVEVRARAALGYTHLLEGAGETALAAVADLPAANDAAEAAGAVLHLKMGAWAAVGRYDDAAAALDDAARRCEASGEASGDVILLGRTELNRAYVDRRRGRPDEALRALERAAEIFAGTDHVPMRALAANNLGALRRDRGELARASRELEHALILRRRLGDRFGAASSLASLGIVALDAGRIGLARRTLERAANELAEGGHASELAYVDGHLALADAWLGESRPAAAGTPAALVARRNALEGLRLLQAGESGAHLVPTLLDAAQHADMGEAFRIRALALALGERGALDDDAWDVLGEVRAAERRWRGREASREPDLDTLRAWLALFDREGRTDLVRAVGRALVSRLDARESDERRRSQALVDAATESLVEGLEPGTGEIFLACLDRFAAADSAGSIARLDLDWFLSSNRALALASDLDELLARLLDLALETTGALRGFLVLLEEERVVAHQARGMGEGDLAEEERLFSSGVVREAVAGGEAIVSLDPGRDARFESFESVRALGLRSVLCVPIPGETTPVGALYLDDDRHQALFDGRDVDGVRALADQAAIAIRQIRDRREIDALNARLRERVDFQGRELATAHAALRRRGETAPLGGLVGGSEPMRRLRATIERIAPTDLSVLVTGPSGSGKELVARALHEYSGRADGPFVVENVAALPESLMESELFGHVRGAFTGAERDRPGLFFEADGGSFFLDEVGEMPVVLQAKLLRVLESGEVRPVGGSGARRVDVRVIAATHAPLARLVEEGAFRRDLYYRLNAVEIVVPSLGDRVEDIPLLIEHFLGRLADRYGREARMNDRVLARLMERPWPGGVRELSNEVTRLFFLSESSIDDPDLVREPSAVSVPSDAPPCTLEEAERAAIRRALVATSGNKMKAARVLGISRAGLYTKLERLGIE